MMIPMADRIRAALERFNAGDLEGYLQLYAEDAAMHYLPPGLPGGTAGGRVFYGMFMGACPDVRVDVDEVMEAGDRAAVRFTMSGTQQGELMGMPGSGKHFSVEGITILRFAGDKCVERWSQTDMLGLMGQISM